MTAIGRSIMELQAKVWEKPPQEETRVIVKDADFEIQKLAQQLANLRGEADKLGRKRLEILNQMEGLKASIDKIIREYKVPEFLAKNVKSKPKGLSLKDAEKELAKLSPEAQARFWEAVRAKKSEGKSL